MHTVYVFVEFKTTMSAANINFGNMNQDFSSSFDIISKVLTDPIPNN